LQSVRNLEQCYKELNLYRESYSMTRSWNIAIPAAVVALAASAITWQIYEGKTAERKLDERVKSCRASAELGDAKGENCLGYIYHHGEGVPQDDAEALRWYRKAADQGSASAQLGVGNIYSYSNVVPIDYLEALRWYHKAADLGDSSGMASVGNAYYYGRGVTQDRSEADRWYRLAADKGYARAQYDLALSYYFGNGIIQNHSEAYRWFHKSADGGNESAQRFLHQYPAGWKNVWFASIITQCIFAILLLVDCLRRSGRFNGSSARVVVYANIIGLLSGALGLFLYIHRELYENLSAFIVLTLIRWLLAVLWVVVLIYNMRRPRRELLYVSEPVSDPDQG
jgi:TPR repeat protein